MRYDELFESKHYFYHGSNDYFPVGTILTPTNNYEERWSGTDFYNVLEKYRPSEMISHKEAVFMVDNDEDIDNVGGGTEYVFTLKPLSKVEKHDISWSTEISILIDEGYSIDSEEVKKAAENYWNGVVHKDGPLWEYLTKRAEIVDVEEF